MYSNALYIIKPNLPSYKIRLGCQVVTAVSVETSVPGVRANTGEILGRVAFFWQIITFRHPEISISLQGERTKCEITVIDVTTARDSPSPLFVSTRRNVLEVLAVS